MADMHLESRAIDPRVTRTRELLREAVRRLLRERDPGDLSVTDITTAAKVSRPTFYLHYGSPDELIADAVREDLRALLDAAPPAVKGDDGVPPVMLALLTEVNRLRWLYGRLVGKASPFGRSREEVAGYLAERFAELIAVRQPAIEDALRNDAAQFLAGGTLNLLAAWISAEEVAGPAEVTAFAERAWRLIRTVVEALGD
ncbi:TetR/AcrR family transcriptional regulator [Cryptosporangium aurantiacum]|uniref:Transcriptional regulator, TetR family n=1 Tax=Cryptosporangium aurantiacum TaxID=134849 RepID=A0A1M7PFD6_9ACTN|nr:TetR/AcrR family transcriptional regulator [Cryptosporangium aurantiacum]SHN15698.1 transcriptional regulator, TetR family [Cryptosporangium aurantiacum]